MSRRPRLARRGCEVCGEEYQPYDADQRYCKACRHVEFACEVCGAHYTRLRRRLAKYPSRFCSLKCMWEGKSNGGLHFNVSMGRWQIFCRDGSTILFARAVMEAELKRPLGRLELVHHRNGDSTDDRPENLQVVTHSEHAQIHLGDIRAGMERAKAARS